MLTALFFKQLRTDIAALTAQMTKKAIPRTTLGRSDSSDAGAPRMFKDWIMDEMLFWVDQVLRVQRWCGVAWW